MITKEELTTIAHLRGLHAKNAERDYLLELSLYSFSKFGNTLVLKGGTALYKFYNLNRFSEDLDFTMNTRKINIEKMAQTLLSHASLIGIRGSLEEKRRYKNEINVRASFRGPFYDGSKTSMTRITINISLRERPQYLTKAFLVPNYREIPSFTVHVLDAKEILAEKIRAIMTREKPRDVYDLWFLLKRRIPIDEVLINKKLKINHISFEKKEFLGHVERKRGAWKRDLQGLLMGSPPDFEEILQDITKNFTMI